MYEGRRTIAFKESFATKKNSEIVFHFYLFYVLLFQDYCNSAKRPTKNLDFSRSWEKSAQSISSIAKLNCKQSITKWSCSRSGLCTTCRKSTKCVERQK